MAHDHLAHDHLGAEWCLAGMVLDVTNEVSVDATVEFDCGGCAQEWQPYHAICRVCVQEWPPHSAGL